VFTAELSSGIKMSLSILAYFAFIKFYVGEDLVLTSQTAILTFISMPIASTGVLALVG